MSGQIDNIQKRLTEEIINFNKDKVLKLLKNPRFNNYADSDINNAKVKVWYDVLIYAQLKKKDTLSYLNFLQKIMPLERLNINHYKDDIAGILWKNYDSFLSKNKQLLDITNDKNTSYVLFGHIYYNLSTIINNSELKNKLEEWARNKYGNFKYEYSNHKLNRVSSEENMYSDMWIKTVENIYLINIWNKTSYKEDNENIKKLGELFLFLYKDKKLKDMGLDIHKKQFNNSNLFVNTIAKIIPFLDIVDKNFWLNLYKNLKKCDNLDKVVKDNLIKEVQLKIALSEKQMITNEIKSPKHKINKQQIKTKLF